MAFLQTSYAEEMPVGQVGRRVNMEEWNTISRTASNVIGFAQPVQRTGDHNCSLLAGGEFLGLAEACLTLGHVIPDLYEQYDTVAVMESGVMWALAGVGGATAGMPVYWIAATGRYTVTVGTNTLIPGAEFDSSATDGTLCKIRLKRIVG